MAEPRPRRGHGEDSMYFDEANNYWVAAVSLGYKGGSEVLGELAHGILDDDPAVQRRRSRSTTC